MTPLSREWFQLVNSILGDPSVFRRTMTETRRLSIVLTLPEVEALRRQLRPGEGMNELLRRIVNDRIATPSR